MKYEQLHFVDSSRSVWNYSLMTDDFISSFQKGTAIHAFKHFGAHPLKVLNKNGFYFAVWAPNAVRVSVVGDFNQWRPEAHVLLVRHDRSGIWEGFIPELKEGALYKFYIVSEQGEKLLKADPYAFCTELRPASASKCHRFGYAWKDKTWMKNRCKHNALDAPWNVYELHLGSWMKPVKNDEHSFNSYRQLVDLLVPYILDMGFTHVEFMPVMEFPYDASWGYQCTGYFSATSRFGTPEDLMYLIDQLHQNNIGVILDWVPSHFPGDAHGLFHFDGAHTYEYADRRKGFHPDWNSYIFNYKRGEVRSFLLSSAHFWLEYYHADGIRVDAVNSIVRLDFSRKQGEWEPNEKGTNENLEAISFLQELNRSVYKYFPDVQTIAEDASDWKNITTPVHDGGLGFGMKWMMGWMHDTFKYYKTHHHHREKLQDTFTFSMMYFYDENFMLPLSHDEVVHGKSPMIYKMPGLEFEKFASLRILYAYMYTHPGAKLLFMGNEFAQTTEWNEKTELDWSLLQHVSHSKMKDCLRALSHLYRKEPSLHECQFMPEGFEWIEVDRRNEGVLIYRRKGKKSKDDIIVIINNSNNPYFDWSFEVSGKSKWRELLNTNDIAFWGTGENLNEQIDIQLKDKKTKTCSLKLNIPALSAVILK